jgi:hypothetical protein
MQSFLYPPRFPTLFRTELALMFVIGFARGGALALVAPKSQVHMRCGMDEVMIRDAARALGRRPNDLLNEGMAPELRLSREEALLAQRFAESVADLLTKKLSRR